jgi:hypothetical protein
VAVGCGGGDEAEADTGADAAAPVASVAETVVATVDDSANRHCNAWLDISVAQPVGIYQSPAVMSYAFSTYAELVEEKAVEFPPSDAAALTQMAGAMRVFAEGNRSADSAGPLLELLGPMAGVAANVAAVCGDNFLDNALNG